MGGIDGSLREGFTEPVRDALWGHIYLTPALEDITRSAVFTRLRGIAQLGAAGLVYPGATHTRAAHSLGVYHLTRRLLSVLADRGADWLSACGVRSMLCAALLHDAGHFPYTHSLKELPLVSHEELSARLIRSEPLRSLIGAAGGDPEFAAAIVDGGTAAGGGAELLFYRRLLSGCLDPDKLDYLNRDARFCGVPYGVQDIDFILSTLRPHLTRGIDIDPRGITSIEAMLFSKYLMYRSVYWHRSVRCATAMIKKALLAGLADGALAPADLYGLDDAGLFRLLDTHGHPLFAIGRQALRGRLFSLAAEFPLEEEAESGGLYRIEGRLRLEDSLAEAVAGVAGAAIRGAELIVDVPEPFSFETDLFVLGKERSFDEGLSFWTPQMAASCVRTLRVVRVFIGSDADNTDPRRLEAAIAEALRSLIPLTDKS
jgi:hypothetical protein